ncbi:SEC-C metal-binding domain-containing protein [Synechococcus sp. PCC 7335]|nr:SEC-C metal-binding domain-containing protein [Synechococcus sp. PCC 7335]
MREGAQWFYTQGDLLPAYQPKRTQPCWCGSKLKFKQCHGSKQSL